MRQYDRKTTIDYRSTDDEQPNMNINDKQQTLDHFSIYHADVVKNNMKYMLT